MHISQIPRFFSSVKSLADLAVWTDCIYVLLFRKVIYCVRKCLTFSIQFSNMFLTSQWWWWCFLILPWSAIIGWKRSLIPPKAWQKLIAACRNSKIVHLHLTSNCCISRQAICVDSGDDNFNNLNLRIKLKSDCENYVHTKIWNELTSRTLRLLLHRYFTSTFGPCIFTRKLTVVKAASGKTSFILS